MAMLNNQRVISYTIPDFTRNGLYDVVCCPRCLKNSLGSPAKRAMVSGDWRVSCRGLRCWLELLSLFPFSSFSGFWMSQSVLFQTSYPDIPSIKTCDLLNILVSRNDNHPLLSAVSARSSDSQISRSSSMRSGLCRIGSLGNGRPWALRPGGLGENLTKPNTKGYSRLRT